MPNKPEVVCPPGDCNENRSDVGILAYSSSATIVVDAATAAALTVLHIRVSAFCFIKSSMLQYVYAIKLQFLSRMLSIVDNLDHHFHIQFVFCLFFSDFSIEQ